MSDQTTRNLGREVKKALGWKSNFADYPHDLNACARDLTVEGYRVVLKQMVDGWEVDYYIEDQIDTLYGEPFVYAENGQLAVAWCEAFLALCKYVEAKGKE